MSSGSFLNFRGERFTIPLRTHTPLMKGTGRSGTRTGRRRTIFYDNPEIADQYSLLTCLDGQPIGFVTWDPRNRPEYVEIGHNGIREQYKGRGYGRLQLEEALRRIREYEGLKRIIVCTNSNLIAPKNYESAGFVLYDRKPNLTESAFAGDYLYYEIML